MMHFEASGLWYPSDDSSNAVGGTLKFNDEGLHLFLLGSFRQGWSPGTVHYPIIHGVLGESPYGPFATLIDSFRNQSKFNMVGVTSEKILCQKAVVGNFHFQEGPTHLQSLGLDFSYLSEWVGFGGMKVERGLVNGKTYIATFNKPDDVEFSFGKKTLTLGFNFDASESSHRTTLTEAARLVTQPVGDLTPVTLGEDDIRLLQDLLSFATDRPNAVEEIAYRAEKDERGITPKLNLIYDPIFRLVGEKEFLHSFDMVFCYSDTQAAGFDIFQRWYDLAKKYQKFITVYFSSIYAKPKFLEDRFEKVLLAFTLLCETLKGSSEKARLFLDDTEKAMKAHFPDDERIFLGHVLPIGSEIEMPLHMLTLLNENSDLMSQVIDNFPCFVKSVSDTLYFIHRRVEGTRPSLQRGELFYAMEKINMLIKIIILKELGFGEDAVKTLVARNNRLNHLKTV